MYLICCSDQSSSCCHQCKIADSSKVCYDAARDCREITYCEYPLLPDSVSVLKPCEQHIKRCLSVSAAVVENLVILHLPYSKLCL